MSWTKFIMLAGCALQIASAQSLQATNSSPVAMARIPAGTYVPAFRQPTEPSQVPVDAFLIDVKPVTNGEYLEFVRSEPHWRKSKVKRLFADEQYLSDWAGDLDLGTLSENAPVARVSWYAARAYARWVGKRLPTTVEWEYVAQASVTAANALADPKFRAQLQTLYTAPTPAKLPDVPGGMPNFYGVHDLHGVVWEWVSDFGTAMVTGDARGDAGLDRQLFCGSGAQGAKDTGDFPTFMRFAFRSSLKASYTVHNLGFRCAKSL